MLGHPPGRPCSTCTPSRPLTCPHSSCTWSRCCLLAGTPPRPAPARPPVCTVTLPSPPGARSSQELRTVNPAGPGAASCPGPQLAPAVLTPPAPRRPPGLAVPPSRCTSALPLPSGSHAEHKPNVEKERLLQNRTKEGSRLPSKQSRLRVWNVVTLRRHRSAAVGRTLSGRPPAQPRLTRTCETILLPSASPRRRPGRQAWLSRPFLGHEPRFPPGCTAPPTPLPGGRPTSSRPGSDLRSTPTRSPGLDRWLSPRRPGLRSPRTPATPHSSGRGGARSPRSVSRECTNPQRTSPLLAEARGHCAASVGTCCAV